MPSAVNNDSGASTAPQQTLEKKLTMAFIGCGFVSDFHLKAIKDIPDVEVVAGCDINPSRLEWMKDVWGVAKGYSDWKQMLREIRPDIVNVCTPNALHLQPTVDALSAGCNVLVEKPMAMSPAEAQQMIAAAEKNGKKLCIGFQFRYHPATQFLKRFRDEGAFGNIMFVKCQALRRRGIPNWGVFGQKHLQGGGPMIDIGVHVIEMAHYAMGSPRPVAASGNTWTYLGNKPSDVVSRWPNWDYKTYTVEDLAIGQIRFENGAILQIEAAFAAHIEKDEWNFSLVGDKGGAQWDPPQVFTDRAGTMVNTAPAFLPESTGFQDLFNLKLQNFVAAVAHDRPMEAPGEAGLAVQKMLDGVYRSAEAGREVSID